MNYLMRFTLPVLGSLLVSQMSFAGYPNKAAIAYQCNQESRKLNHIIASNPENKCAGDVGVAAAYLDAAELQIQREHYNQALVSLHYSESELRNIAYSRAYCDFFSTLVKPSIAQVIRISSELEVLEHAMH